METIKGQQLSVSAAAAASMQLTSEEMQSIRGKWWDKLSAAGKWIAENIHGVIGPIFEFRFQAEGSNTVNNTTNSSTWSVNITVAFGATNRRGVRRGVRRRSR